MNLWSKHIFGVCWFEPFLETGCLAWRRTSGWHCWSSPCRRLALRGWLNNRFHHWHGTIRGCEAFFVASIRLGFNNIHWFTVNFLLCWCFIESSENTFPWIKLWMTKPTVFPQKRAIGPRSSLKNRPPFWLQFWFLISEWTCGPGQG